MEWAHGEMGILFDVGLLDVPVLAIRGVTMSNGEVGNVLVGSGALLLDTLMDAARVFQVDEVQNVTKNLTSPSVDESILGVGVGVFGNQVFSADTAHVEADATLDGVALVFALVRGTVRRGTVTRFF